MVFRDRDFEYAEMIAAGRKENIENPTENELIFPAASQENQTAAVVKKPKTVPKKKKESSDDSLQIPNETVVAYMKNTMDICR